MQGFLSNSCFPSCPGGPQDGSSRGFETNAHERSLSLEDSKDRARSCMQEAPADGTITGPLESTGDRLVRLPPTSGAPFTRPPKVLPPPSPETAIIPNGIRLLKSIPRIQTVNYSPTRHGRGGLPTGQPLCCLQQTLSQDQQSRSQAVLRFFPRKKRSRAVEVGGQSKL